MTLLEDIAPKFVVRGYVHTALVVHKAVVLFPFGKSRCETARS